MQIDLSDEELVALYNSGNKEIFKNLIDRYTSPLFNFSARIAGKDNATDIVQDTFIKAWKKLHGFNAEKSSFKTWLYVIAKNTIIDFLRKKKSYTFTDLNSEEIDFSETIPDEELLPDGMIEKLEEENKITEVLDKLPPQWKAILILHYQEDLTFDEIGKVFNKPPNTVKSNHRRALIRLREML